MGIDSNLRTFVVLDKRTDGIYATDGTRHIVDTVRLKYLCIFFEKVLTSDSGRDKVKAVDKRKYLPMLTHEHNSPETGEHIR